MDSKTKYVENRTFSGNTSSIGTRNVLLWKVKCLLGSGQVKNAVQRGLVYLRGDREL